MAAFIEQVCHFVFHREGPLREVERGVMLHHMHHLHDPLPVVSDPSTMTMEDVLPMLKRWWFAVAQCGRSEAFKTGVLQVQQI